MTVVNEKSNQSSVHFEAMARLKGFRSSAQKVRLVADSIRGKKIQEALDFLQFSPLKASAAMKKLLESALSNAENNSGASVEPTGCFVSEVYVNEGVTMKRIRPRAKGRADQILKRSCHIFLKISSEEKA
jgi:large subunit ribosomal protein L22